MKRLLLFTFILLQAVPALCIELSREVALTLLGKTIYSQVYDAPWYEILGVNQNASDKEIKKAQIQLIRQWHTDKTRTNTTAIAQAINVACDEGVAHFERMKNGNSVLEQQYQEERARQEEERRAQERDRLEAERLRREREAEWRRRTAERLQREAEEQELLRQKREATARFEQEKEKIARRKRTLFRVLFSAALVGWPFSLAAYERFKEWRENVALKKKSTKKINAPTQQQGARA